MSSMPHDKTSICHTSKTHESARKSLASKNFEYSKAVRNGETIRPGG